ncbi:interferon-inducible GTPase 5-like isoform X2 [Labrus bergylta]|uniref:interferon-inducible GTPase 5-like isoform X2 n=1 Tax=Labrus bergylta TaxID=56723 RepID=UPI003313803F
MGNQSGRQQIDTEIKEALDDDQNLAGAKIQEYLDKDQNVPLNIAVTGETGSGKSTFVNAIRGIDNKDEKAAPTGFVETTMKVTLYPHPNYPNVIFWDLPGIGNAGYPAANYLKTDEFKKFDFFIIISADRFKENDVKLAKEIQKMKKKFYFVRSKIDDNIRYEKRSQKEFNEERTLTQIRENCIQGLQDLGLQSPQVFLVSSFDLTLYDFPLLVETLKEELPELKKEAFLLAMPNISLDMIKEKKKAFQAKVKYFAMLSAAVGAVPVPGLSVAVDTTLLVGVVTKYVLGFGLDIPSLKRMANYSGVPYEELMEVIKSTLIAVKVTPELLMRLLVQFGSLAVLLAAEEGSRFIPLLGIPVSMGLSFAFTYRSLNMILDMLADDAEKVFTRVHLNTTGCSSIVKEIAFSTYLCCQNNVYILIY